MRALVLGVATLFTVVATPQPPWRLRYIDLRIRIDPSAHSITGVSSLDFSRTGTAAADLVVDLADSMVVDSARVTIPGSATPVIGVREPGHVRFALTGVGATSAPKSLYRAAIWYHGQPIRRAVGFAEHEGSPRPASFGLPRSAREWWPTIDDPEQKADSADIRITAPAKSIVASNGRLVDRVSAADGSTATSHWAVRHPIYPDVVSFAIGDYAVTRQSVALSEGRHVPLELYVFSEDSAKGAVDLASVPKILPFLEGFLGRYPFADEKYAMAEFARPSFREGQTITNLGANFFTGKGTSDQVIAHEISHQWFGNSLSVRKWEDIWLNESLSEFMSWQWIRKSQGDSAYYALFDQATSAEYPAPIAPAKPDDFGTMFGPATFVKGPVVVSMMRDVVGERAFAAALRAYVAGHAYGSVDAADFQQAVEKAYGKPLDWFFKQWIYGSQVPKIALTWKPAANGALSVKVVQSQSGTPFQLPLELRVSKTDGGTVARRVWLSKADEEFTLRDVGSAKDVTIDHRTQLVHIAP